MNQRSSQFVEISAKLNEVIDRSLKVMSGFGVSDWEAIPGTSWTKAMILGHLTDSAVNNHNRFVRGIYMACPVISYDQNLWSEAQLFRVKEPKMLLDFWVSHNRYIALLLKSLPQEMSSRPVNTGSTEMTLAELAEDYLVHLQHHLRQITGMEAI